MSNMSDLSLITYYESAGDSEMKIEVKPDK